MAPHGQDNRNPTPSRYEESERLGEDPETVHEGVEDDDKETAIVHMDGESVQKAQKSSKTSISFPLTLSLCFCLRREFLKPLI